MCETAPRIPQNFNLYRLRLLGCGVDGDPSRASSSTGWLPRLAA